MSEGYSIVDWYDSHKAVLRMLIGDVDRIQRALDAGNIAGVRDGFLLLRKNMEHTCVTWQPPSFALDAALKDSVHWAGQTFPLNTPATVLAHLLREVAGLERRPDSAEEIADVAILLATLAAIQGIDIAAAVRDKMEINKARRWGPRDAQGVVEHIREEAPSA